MRSTWDDRAPYRKNLQLLQGAADQLLSHMKGHDWSFRREITDRKGDFSQEKLCSLVEEMLSLWAEDLRKGRATDPATGQSVAEPYIGQRLELYRPYLYLVMRCSLCQGAYSDARNGAEKQERPDFAFLLAQAKQLFQNWCVMTEKDGTHCNDLYDGLDGHFGFHLYRALRDPDGADGCNGNDWSLTPDWKRACDKPIHLLTDEGTTKRISIIHLSDARRAAGSPAKEVGQSEEPAPPDEDAFDAEDGYDAEDDYDGYDYDPAEDDDFWDLWGVDDAFRQAEMDQLAEQEDRRLSLEILCMHFECSQEYLSACKDFQEHFAKAKPEVLRDFYKDLEDIVDLYLVKRDIPPLMDADKMLDVYDRICEGALRQAKRYGRGIQWKGL